jgi:hypothetical protein
MVLSFETARHRAVDDLDDGGAAVDGGHPLKKPEIHAQYFATET